VLDDPAAISAARWNALLDTQADATPFMRHEYLAALHASGSATAETGWQPQFLVVEQGDALVAACPLYLKDHSYGEYVFDWAWADATSGTACATTRSCCAPCRSRRCPARA
jgi:predicted N-acyltransferase